MVKGKFKFIFRDGSTMIDRNGYKSISGARLWARAHNLASETLKQERVIKVVPLKKKKKR